MADLIQDFPNLPPEIQQQILDSPASPPPDGVEPNFENPETHDEGPIAVLCICLALTTIAVVGRAYTRVAVVKKVQAQDWLGLLALGAYIALAITYTRFVIDVGFYRHSWDLQVRDLEVSLRIMALALPITYSATHLFAKTAILLEWIRLFSPHRTRPWFYWCCWTLIVLNCMVYISAIVSSAVICIPLESYWSPWIDGSCVDFRALTITSAFFNTLLDVLILLLPQGIIWRLHVNKGRKISISLIFSVGLLATACAAGRTAATFAVEFEGDGIYTMSPVFIWALAEATCVMLVFCLPCMPKAFTETSVVSRVVRSVRSWTSLRNLDTSNHNQSEQKIPPVPDLPTTPSMAQSAHSKGSRDTERRVMADLELSQVDWDDARAEDTARLR